MQHIAPEAQATVAMSAEQVNQVIAEAVEKALREAGLGKNGKKDRGRQLPKVAYSVREASGVCSVSRSGLYEAIRRRELRVLKKGARTLVLDRDLRRWLEGLPPTSD
jgi:hypothetical protein